jgi:5-methylcytosine-specific restriction endonuclease McrA
MTEYIPIAVQSKRYIEEQKFRYLLKKGLKYYGKEDDLITLKGEVTKKQYSKLLTYCIKHRLKCKIDNGYGDRSEDYRIAFRGHTRPFLDDKYICAYCGRLFPWNEITVDHLYPVDAAGRSLRVQRKLLAMGCTDVNDIKNLVPACRSCNSRKGKKINGYILRGRIGRHPSVWVFRYILRAVVILAIICGVVKVLQYVGIL